LGDVPNITAETNHFKFAAMVCNLIEVFLDGELLPG
jgi:hypothetical protein